jgi:hypothetical protein
MIRIGFYMGSKALLHLGCLLLILSVASVDAFILDESIEVYNKANTSESAGGFLYSRTDATGLKGMVVGVGSQTYHENLGLNSESTVYSSSYNLTSLSDNRSNNYQNYMNNPMGIGGKDGIIDYVVPNTKALQQNRYAIQMNSLDGLSHFINLRTDNNIIAVSAITHDKTKHVVSTSYNLETNGGEVAEGITNKEGQRHPHFVVERMVSGFARIRSNLTDIESKQFFSDQASLQDKVEAVNMAGETGRISLLMPSNNILVESPNGDLKVNISSDTPVHIPGSVGMPEEGYTIGFKETALSRAEVQQPIPAAQEAAAKETKESISTAITVRNTTFIIPDDNSAANENISTAIIFNNTTFIIPNDNSAANEIGSIPSANSSVANLPVGSDPLLSIMSVDDESLTPASTCPYQGLAGNSTTPCSQSLQGVSLVSFNATDKNATVDNWINNSGENRTVDFGGATFIIAETDPKLLTKRTCAKQYLGLSSVDLVPPCLIRIGHGMGESEE